MMNDQQIEEYHKKVDDNINKSGYHITYVSGEPAFCYSTGVYRSFGIPEIFISALPPNLSGELVTNYINKFKDADQVPVNQLLDDLSDRFPVYLIAVDPADLEEYVLSSQRFYGSQNYTYVQLIYPDTQGYFPHEQGYEYDQEIRGNFPGV
ncbi:DUF4262 domain-containing protein [Hymenobacter sp. B81]|uniref:DUF4262 domain-containing protein n=1 Tax=Hymenobacter sp. B81 TaxID=3344878 RepID=UPI0037DCB546